MKYLLLILPLISFNLLAQNVLNLDTTNIQSGNIISGSQIKSNLDEIDNNIEQVSHAGVPSILTNSSSNVNPTGLTLKGIRVGKTYHLAVDYRYEMTANVGGSFLNVIFDASDVAFLSGKNINMAGGSLSCNVNGSDNRHQTAFMQGGGTSFNIALVGDDSTVTGRLCAGTVIIVVD